MVRTAWHTVAGYGMFLFAVLFKTPELRKLQKLNGTRPDSIQAAEVHRAVSVWARRIIKVTGARLRVRGLEGVPVDRAVLFVSNHLSVVDIVVFLAVTPCPIGFVAKVELLKAPLLRAWMKLMRCVFIDRKDMRQSAKVILEGIGILKSGHSMVVFPEGTRSRTGKPLPFKPGSLKLATKSGACVVPVTLGGSQKILEANNYKVKPADVDVCFHPPVFLEDLDADMLAKLPGMVERTVTATID